MSAIESAGPSAAASAPESRNASKLNLFRVHFEALYRRHLCRHGQFGINVLHIIAVLGIYYSLLELTAAGVEWLLPDVGRLPGLGVLILPYLVVLLVNIPLRVMVTTVICLAGLFALVAAELPIPVWLHVPLILLWHRFQLWSHGRYTLHRDMTAFDRDYPKGAPLFVVLSVYELPILLNYLLFGRADWVFGSGSEPTP